MAKTKEQKQEIVARATENFRNMKSAAFSSISGFTMAQADELRNKARLSGVKVFIAKKTLLSIATKEAGVKDFDPGTLDGSILTAISLDDEVSAAKILHDLTKENEDISLVAGILEGKGISTEEVIQLASLPQKDELLAQVVRTLNAPMSGFVQTLTGNARGLVTVLNAIGESK